MNTLSTFGGIEKLNRISIDESLKIQTKYNSLFFGIGFDGVPVLFDAFDGGAVLFLGNYNFEKMKWISAKRQFPYEIAEITKQELYSNVGANKILALEKWVQTPRHKPMVVLVEGLEEVYAQDPEIERCFMRLVENSMRYRISIIAKTVHTDTFASMYSWSIIRKSIHNIYSFEENGRLVEFYVPE